MKISKDDFEAWLQNPVTVRFFVAVQVIADRARDSWSSASWHNEKIWTEDRAKELRAACRARAECAEDILAITFEEENEV